MTLSGRSWVWTALAGALWLSAAGHAEAQQGVRRGMWLEGAIGTGTVRNGCGGCAEVTSAYGGTDYLRVGRSITPRVSVGLEVFALSASNLEFGSTSVPIDAENRSLAPIVMWYVGRSGFFLKGGAGLARGTFTVRTSDGETVTTTRTGSALMYGLGFDVGILSWLAVTASLGSNVMAIGDLPVDGDVVDDVIATVYEVGVGLTLR